MLNDIKVLEARNKFIDFLYKLGVFIAVPLVFLSILRGLNTGFNIANYFHILILIILTSTLLFKDKINYNIKASMLIISIFSLGTIGIYSYATLSSDIATFLLFIFLSVLLFGKRAGVIAVIISGISVTTIASLYSLEILKLNFNPNFYISSKASWLDIIISFILYGAVIVILIDKFYNEFKETIKKLKEETNNLSIEKERLSITFTSINESIITTDENGYITFLNKQAETLIGKNLSELNKKHISKTFKIMNEENNTPIDNIFELIINEKTQNLKTILFMKDINTKLIIRFNASKIKNTNKNTVGIIITFRDITKERKYEEEMLKIKKLESVGSLAGGIAHDFNNLLLGIVGNLDLAQSELLDHNIKEANRSINDSLKACMKATYLTHKLLIFSRGGKPIKDILSLSNTINDSSGFITEGHNIKLEINIDDNLWLINGDKYQISQVIQNLILNSIEASSENGEIKINCKNINITNTNNLILSGEYIHLNIIDYGIGIKEEDLEKIFTPYFTSKGQGRGLGLAITYSIIKNHRGYIFVDSSPEKGTSIEVYFPKAMKKVDKLKLEVLESTDIIPQNNKKKILVMDDEVIIRKMLDKILKKLNYDVTLTKSGEEAVKEYKNNKYDLAIFDISIPTGMGGDEALAKILNFDKNAKIIATSGYSTNANIKGYKEIGFIDFIAKPYKITELESKLNKFL